MTSAAAQTDLILAALVRGDKLTPLDALRRFGCLRLGARIWDIRQRGVAVQRKMVKTGKGKNVAMYFIPPPPLELQPPKKRQVKPVGTRENKHRSPTYQCPACKIKMDEVDWCAAGCCGRCGFEIDFHEPDSDIDLDAEVAKRMGVSKESLQKARDFLLRELEKNL